MERSQICGVVKSLRYAPTPTYELGTNEHGQPYIRCLDCGRTSYHPVDISERYCGYCHEFHSIKRLQHQAER